MASEPTDLEVLNIHGPINTFNEHQIADASRSLIIVGEPEPAPSSEEDRGWFQEVWIDNISKWFRTLSQKIMKTMRKVKTVLLKKIRRARQVIRSFALAGSEQLPKIAPGEQCEVGLGQVMAMKDDDLRTFMETTVMKKGNHRKNFALFEDDCFFSTNGLRPHNLAEAKSEVVASILKQTGFNVTMLGMDVHNSKALPLDSSDLTLWEKQEEFGWEDFWSWICYELGAFIRSLETFLEQCLKAVKMMRDVSFQMFTEMMVMKTTDNWKKSAPFKEDDFFSTNRIRARDLAAKSSFMNQTGFNVTILEDGTHPSRIYDVCPVSRSDFTLSKKQKESGWEDFWSCVGYGISAFIRSLQRILNHSLKVVKMMRNVTFKIFTEMMVMKTTDNWKNSAPFKEYDYFLTNRFRARDLAAKSSFMNQTGFKVTILEDGTHPSRIYDVCPVSRSDLTLSEKQKESGWEDFWSCVGYGIGAFIRSLETLLNHSLKAVKMMRDVLFKIVTEMMVMRTTDNWKNSFLANRFRARDVAAKSGDPYLNQTESRTAISEYDIHPSRICEVCPVNAPESKIWGMKKGCRGKGISSVGRVFQRIFVSSPIRIPSDFDNGLVWDGVDELSKFLYSLFESFPEGARRIKDAMVRSLTKMMRVEKRSSPFTIHMKDLLNIMEAERNRSVEKQKDAYYGTAVLVDEDLLSIIMEAGRNRSAEKQKDNYYGTGFHFDTGSLRRSSSSVSLYPTALTHEPIAVEVL
ncbi:hypothetical protein HDU67_009049 [Dinochytrium kinnereticum]|nr:hypothetical protein HDU67_009049 [Dinochytrium kinnereticum]